MLSALSAAFVGVAIFFVCFLILAMNNSYHKNKKLLSDDSKICLAVVIISLILSVPLHFAQKAVEKNIEIETNYTQLDTENCYMITSMSKNGNTLFICKENGGELRYVWAKLEETNSTPCLETSTYKMSSMEKILTWQVENEYVISTNSKYIKFVYDINDVPLGKFE